MGMIQNDMRKSAPHSIGFGKTCVEQERTMLQVAIYSIDTTAS